uniref:BRCT domain-containing protein n=1 Tax=Panagrellus redivivus TaxID=6233 RepID=A0A7E4V8D0_PANRE
MVSYLCSVCKFVYFLKTLDEVIVKYNRIFAVISCSITLLLKLLFKTVNIDKNKNRKINHFVFEVRNSEAVKKLTSDAEYMFVKTLKIDAEKTVGGWHGTNVTRYLTPNNDNDRKTTGKIKAFCESTEIREAIESLQAYSASPINFTTEKLESVVTQSEGNAILKRQELKSSRPMFHRNRVFSFIVERICRKRKHS